MTDTKITSSFHRLAVTPQEQLSGSILSTLQIASIQNHRVDIAEQKLNLVFDPTNMIDFAQQNAYLQGQLDILQLLLDSSEASSQAAVVQSTSSTN